MTTFYTADTHLSHQNILALDNRPFKTIEEHDTQILKNFNEIMGPDDHLIHLGDASMGKIADSLPKWGELNVGYKTLMCGNHDRPFAGNKQKERDRFLPIYKQFFDEIFDGHAAIPFLLEDEQGRWVETVWGSHFPHDSDHTDDIRYAEYRPHEDPDAPFPLICGHTHEKYPVQRSKKGTLQIHVSVTAHDYYPVSELEIIRLIEENR